MPDKPALFRPPHQATERERDRARAALQPWRGWYKRAIWAHPVYGLRAQQLRRQPLCENCLTKTPQQITAATVVHHKRPHRGDWSLFVDPDNHASWCKPCHDSEAQAAERGSAGAEPGGAGTR
jgi:5-methylcytosine-specific restriction enzyme A